MNSDMSEIMDIRKWNRNMLKAYWFVLLATFVTQAVFLVTTSPTSLLFIGENLLQPAVYILIILLLTELLNYHLRRFNEYVIIASGTIIVTTLLYYHPDISGLNNASFLPILISVFYFRVSKVIFTFILMILVTFALYFLKSMHVVNNDALFVELITTTSILTCGTVICLGIMHRGIELVQRLRSTMESRQELLVQNIIMDRLSKIDPLTELYNHITFHEYLSRLTEQSDKFGFPLQLAVLDIDNFKQVNDTFGHRAGDAVIKRIAESLQQHVHANDFVARYGGEEFAILFSEKNLNDVFETLNQIRIHIAGIQHPELGNNIVTISIGLSEYKRGTNKEVLFKLADEALYLAKKSGKNRILIKTEVDGLYI